MTPRISTVALWRSLRRLLSVLAILIVIGFATGAVIVIQASRSETPTADAALVVLGDERGSAARLDRARQLYLDGNIGRVLLLGTTAAPSRDTLLGRGVKPEAIVVLDQPSQVDQITAATQTLQQDRLLNALLIAEPVETLRLLKVSRDNDLQPSSLPTGAGSDISIGGVIAEVGRYYRYVLLHR